MRVIIIILLGFFIDFAYGQIGPPFSFPSSSNIFVWGSATNQLQAGVFVEASSKRFTIYLRAILNNGKEVNTVALPKPSERFSVEMRTETGESIPLTRQGRALGQSVRLSPSGFDKFLVFLRARHDSFASIQPSEFPTGIGSFEIWDIFEKPPSGIYTILVTERVYSSLARSGFTVLVLPPVSLRIKF